MKKSIISILILYFVLVAATACGLLQEPAEPSATLEAVPLEIEEVDEPIEVEEEATAVPEPTEQADEPPVELDEAEEPEEVVEEEATETPEPTEEPEETCCWRPNYF